MMISWTYALEQRLRLRRWALIGYFLSLFMSFANAGSTITSARYEAPVDRYGHFALGQPHEYARLSATTDTGRTVSFELPDDEVFEDLAPRLVRMGQSEAYELLTIVSKRGSGARLMLIRLAAGRLQISAESPAIGIPNRWLNPVGVADLDGDGRAEITAVITPHIGGTLKAYRRSDNRLIEIAALTGFSNHVYGSRELALSALLPVDGRTRLVVPDMTRRRLRVIGLEDDRLVELARCHLPEPIVGALSVISPASISIAYARGVHVINLSACFPNSKTNDQKQ